MINMLFWDFHTHTNADQTMRVGLSFIDVCLQNDQKYH